MANLDLLAEDHPGPAQSRLYFPDLTSTAGMAVTRTRAWCVSVRYVSVRSVRCVSVSSVSVSSVSVSL